jgi:type IV pilus biogenesis protein CpaD/CtpE
MTRYTRLGLAIVGCLVGLAGCSSRDPYKRDDVWYPTGANAANLAAQVADPADLAGGRGDPKQRSAAQIKAVTRILTDAPKALSGGSTTAAGGGGETPSPPAAPAGGT